MIDPNNYVAVPDRNPETGLYVLRVGPKSGGLPHEMPVWTGDAIHNLASSLDYLWSSLARQADPSLATRALPAPRNAAKPHRYGFEVAGNESLPTIEGLILDEMKPYKDRNFRLWSVGKLDNIDEHRLLFTAMSIAKFGKFREVSEDGRLSICLTAPGKPPAQN